MNTLSEKLKETIGELKTANNELQKDIEEKIRIDEARKEFIANVSHELKNTYCPDPGICRGTYRRNGRGSGKQGLLL